MHEGPRPASTAAGTTCGKKRWEWWPSGCLERRGRAGVCRLEPLVSPRVVNAAGGFATQGVVSPVSLLASASGATKGE